jgi:hypothetical protein
MNMPVGRIEQVLSSIEPPDSTAAIGFVQWDREGNLWVSRTAPQGGGPSAIYDVFDGDGRWVTTVPVPVEFGRIRDVGEDYILFSTADALGVPTLRMHRLVKSGPEVTR